jgi:hypothetical protein
MFKQGHIILTVGKTREGKILPHTLYQQVKPVNFDWHMWRKLHNEELHNLYSSPSIIRITKSKTMRWAGHMARMGEKRNVYRLLVGKPEGKRPLGMSET